MQLVVNSVLHLFRCLGESRNVYSYSARTSEIGRQGPVSFTELNSSVPCLDPDNCPSEEVSR